MVQAIFTINWSFANDWCIKPPNNHDGSPYRRSSWPKMMQAIFTINRSLAKDRSIKPLSSCAWPYLAFGGFLWVGSKLLTTETWKGAALIYSALGCLIHGLEVFSNRNTPDNPAVSSCTIVFLSVSVFFCVLPPWSSPCTLDWRLAINTIFPKFPYKRAAISFNYWVF